MSSISQGCYSEYITGVVTGENAVLMSNIRREKFDGTSPLVLYGHTHANTGLELQGYHFFGWTGPQYLASQGFIVIGAVWGSTTNWGNEGAVTAMEEARTWAIANGAKNGPIGLWGNSMGFMTVANYWNEHQASVGKVFGGSPVSNASHMYSNPSFTAEMDAAYGGSFTTNGASRSPHLLLPNISGAGSKLKINYSSADTTVSPSDVTSMCNSVGVTPTDVEPATPSGHVSYLAPQNDQVAIVAHFSSLK